MRYFPAPALAAAAVLAPAAAVAQASHPWVTQVGISRLDERLAGDPGYPQPPSIFNWKADWSDWITPADVPKRFRDRAFSAESRLVLDIDPAGKPSACRALGPGAEPSLDALACDLLVRRGTFETRYAAPARPIPYRFVASVKWTTARRPEGGEGGPGLMRLIAPGAPVPPPEWMARYRGWPRLAWTGEVLFGEVADIQHQWPGGAEGTASVELTVSARDGVTRCEVGVSAGSAALDEAACRVARSIEMRYPVPCEFCIDAKVPLQVVWRRAGSEIRLPRALPSSGAPLTGNPLTRADFKKVAKAPLAGRSLAVQLDIDADGRPRSCRIRSGSGEPAVDKRACQLLVRRMRYSIRTDVFGNPVAHQTSGQIDLATLP